MKVKMKVKGLNQVMKNLNNEVRKIIFLSEKGLLKAGLYIKRESQQIVPVDTGNLKSSAFTESIGTYRKPIVIIGYGASYAVFVHEIPPERARHASGKSWKYLQIPIQNNIPTILDLIKSEIRV